MALVKGKYLLWFFINTALVQSRKIDLVKNEKVVS